MALSVTLNWDASANATSYKVSRKNGSGPAPYTFLGDTTIASYTDASPIYGMGHTYSVVAVGQGGDSAAREVYIVITVPAPAPVVNLTATLNQ